MGSDALLLAALVASAAIAMLASLVNRSLRTFSRHELEMLCRRRNRPDYLGAILQNRRSCRMAAETLQVIAAACTLWAAFAWLHWPVGSWAAGAVLLATGVLVFAEVWLSRAIAHLWAERFLLSAWPGIALVVRLFGPLVAMGKRMDKLLHRLAGRAPEADLRAPVEEEVHVVVGEAEREGLLAPDAREMIERAIEMRSQDVCKIMTPRTDMFTIPVTATVHEAVQLVNEGAHSRVPVYGENRDDIVGILYVRDLLTNLGNENGRPRSVEQIMRAPYYVPETKSVPALLQEFRRHQVQIAIVLDEYGGVSGLVTIEDILEEIVGEIADEYEDAVPEAIRAVEENVVEVDGRIHVDELNERLGLELPEDGDFETIGGFVFSHLGRLPQQGECFHYGHVRFTMVAVGKRHVDRVKLELDQESEKLPQDDAVA